MLRGRGTEDTIDFGFTARPPVTVESPPGETLEIKGPGFRMGSSLITGSGSSRGLIGTIQIAQPGAYTVTARETSTRASPSS